MNIMALLFLAISSAVPNCCQDNQQFSQTFISNGKEYEVRFIEGSCKDCPWPVDLIMRWRIPDTNEWHVVSKIKGVRLERIVNLPTLTGSNIEALVVSAPGGSAEFISVVEIRKNDPKLIVLLDKALDKGGFEYRFDNSGRLIGFKFTYLAWHVSPPLLKGHVFTANNIGWITDKQKFQSGPIYVDTQREQSASLIDILTAIGSDILLDIEETHDEDFNTYTYIYKPTGLLWSKTPSNLRSAEKVKVIIKYGTEPECKPYISEISAVEE